VLADACSAESPVALNKKEKKIARLPLPPFPAAGGG
jgi:hypothetical protein